MQEARHDHDDDRGEGEEGQRGRERPRRGARRPVVLSGVVPSLGTRGPVTTSSKQKTHFFNSLQPQPCGEEQ